MKRFACWLLVMLFLGIAAWGEAPAKNGPKEITVAAAADLSSALKEIAENYEKETGVKVKFSFGASGALTQQIRNRAPFDVFLSADMDYPRQLISHGDAEGGSLYRYAIGKLALWAPADSPLDVEHRGMNVMADASVKKIAIANPQHAPYGRAAVAALKHVELYEQVSDRLVLGENVSQAAQFVESGNAQVGLISLTAASAPHFKEVGSYVLVPTTAYPPIVQYAVVMAKSERKADAHAFLDWLLSPAVQGNLANLGLGAVK